MSHNYFVGSVVITTGRVISGLVGRNRMFDKDFLFVCHRYSIFLNSA